MTNSRTLRLLSLGLPAISALLVGCAASSGPAAGMNTVLKPGEAVAIMVDQGDGRVQVSSGGPGALVVRRQDAPSPELHAGSPGDVLFTTRGREHWTATNESSDQTAVDIRIWGVEHAQITGPVAPPAR